MMKSTTKKLFSIGILSAALLAPIAPNFATAASPYLKADNSWISIDGKVKSVTSDSFVLNYGEGDITVKMDDGDRDGDAYKLLPNDKVTVSGEIDDNLFSATEIEASSVFVEKLGTTFFASSADQDAFSYYNYDPDVSIADTMLNGTVSSVEGRTFTLNTGNKMVKVDTNSLSYNPLDSEGFQRIEKGDRVSVTGEMDEGFFTNRQLRADSILTLEDSSAKNTVKQNQG